MRDVDVIDSSLRLLTAVRPLAAAHSAVPSIAPVDDLLSKRFEAQT